MSLFVVNKMMVKMTCKSKHTQVLTTWSFFLCGIGQVEAGGGAEDGARGIAPQDPRRAMQGSALILGSHSFILIHSNMGFFIGGDQGRRGHVQLTGSRVVRHPHEVRHTPLPVFPCSLPITCFQGLGQGRSVVLCAICVLTINIS